MRSRYLDMGVDIIISVYREKERGMALALLLSKPVVPRRLQGRALYGSCVHVCFRLSHQIRILCTAAVGKRQQHAMGDAN